MKHSPWSIVGAFAAIMLCTYASAYAQNGVGVANSASAASSLSYSAGSGGNSFSNIFGGSTIPKNTPDAVAPSVSSGSSNCVLGWSIGLGVSGFGVSGGQSHPYEECNEQLWSQLIWKYAQMEYDISKNPTPSPAVEQAAWWMRGVICAGNPTIRAMAPPGTCTPAQQAQAAVPVQTAAYYGQRAAQPTPVYQQPVAYPAAPAYQAPAPCAPCAEQGQRARVEYIMPMAPAPAWCASVSPYDRRQYPECQ